MFFVFGTLHVCDLFVCKMGALCKIHIHRKIKNVDISLDQLKNTILQQSNPKACTLTMLELHALAGGRIVEKPLVFIANVARRQIA